MKGKQKKRGFLVCICWMLVAALSLQPQGAKAAEANYSQNYSENQYEKQILDFIGSDSYRYLVLRNNFGYMKFIEDFRSSALDEYLISMSEFLITMSESLWDAKGEPDEPDVEDYIAALSNIITIYDAENSPEIKEQKELDKALTIEDYMMDIENIASDMVSVKEDLSPIEDELLSNVLIVTDGFDVILNSVDNEIDALINLDIVLQNYEKYDAFLALIENNSDGNLKTASSTLRRSVRDALWIKLDAYGDVSIDQIKNFSMFFIDDTLFDIIKSSSLYALDEEFSLCIDICESLKDSVFTVIDSWKYGLDIGKLIGNATVEGEKLIQRVHEMEAIYDISIILQSEIIGRQAGLPQHYYKHTDFDLSEFVDYLNYLICCRKQGEYCLYSIITQDDGLLSWFGQLFSDDADIWYKKQIDILNNIKKSFSEIPRLPITENEEGLPEGILEAYEDLIRQNADESGKVYFGCYDIDSDGVMEMIIAGRDSKFNVYDCIDEKPVLIGQCDYAYFSAVPGGQFITNGNADIIQVFLLDGEKMDLFTECVYPSGSPEDSDAYRDWLSITEWLNNNDSETIPVELYESEDEAINALQNLLYEGESQKDMPQAVKIVSALKNLPYVGTVEHDINVWFDNNMYIAADTVDVKGILSAFKKDFDMDGTKEIFAVTYEPSAIAGGEQNGFWFYMLERTDGKWNIAAATEVYALDWNGNYCNLSFMGAGAPDEFRTSIFLRRYNGEYQFFIESYENGVFATGMGWRLLGYIYNGSSFVPIPETQNLSFLGSDFEYYWNEEDPELAAMYHALGFTSDTFYFNHLTLEQNPETYEIVSLKQSHNSSYEYMYNWLQNQQEPLNDFWCRIEDVCSLIPDGKIPEFTEDKPFANISGNSMDEEYLLPYSDSEFISEKDIEGFSTEDIQRAVNEIYARHGKVFTMPENDEYFRSKSWYVPVEGKTDDQILEEFNDYERENVDFMAQFL